MNRRLFRHARIGAACIVTALLTGAAFAQPSVAPRVDDLAKLPLEQLLDIEVASASRYAQRLADAPSLVSIVTAADIRAYGYRTLGEILRSLPGLHVTYDRNYTYVGVRGLARPGDYNGRILLLVDGHRVNDNIYEQGTPGTEFYLAADVIERVEFVPGPGSSVYGANAFVGVVNVVTRGGADLPGARASAAAGSHDFHSASASYGRPADSGNPAVLLSTTYFDTPGTDLYFAEFDAPETNHGIARGLDFDRAWRVYGKFEWESTRLTFAVSEREKGIPTASFQQSFNDPRSSTTDQFAYLTLDQRFKPASDLEFGVGATYGQYRYRGHYSYGLDVGINDDRATGEWLDVELKGFSTRFERHKIVFGVDYRHSFRRDQSNRNVDPDEVFLDDKQRGHSWGAYLQDEYAISPQWLLSVGVRHDQHSTVGGSTNPRLALIWHANPATSVKAIYGTAFRAPNAYELFYGGSDWKRNPSLEPERIKTAELIVEHYVTREGRVAASVYENRINGLVELQTDPSDGLLVFANQTGAKSRGVELSWDQHWDSGARVQASYSYQRAVDRATGAVLSNAPAHLAKLNVAGPLASWLDAGFEAQYVGRRSTLAGTSAQGYAIANLTLIAHRIVPSLEVAASVYNLFDRRYEDPGSEEHVQNTIAQDGRTFQIKLSYRF